MGGTPDAFRNAKAISRALGLTDGSCESARARRTAASAGIREHVRNVGHLRQGLLLDRYAKGAAPPTQVGDFDQWAPAIFPA